MPTEMRRPRSPGLALWVDEMDRHLRAQVPRRRRRWTPFRAGIMLRVVRSTSRRTVSAAGMVAAAVVVMASVSLPSVAPPLPPVGTDPPVVGIEQQADAGLTHPRDPGPAYLGLFPREDRAAVAATADIATTERELTPVPPSTTRAVPTPMGGGPATAALRPTVR